MVDRIVHVWNGAKRSLRQLNAFDSFSPDGIDEEYKTKTQVISTRIYLILLAIIFSILVIYTSQAPVLRTIVIHSPSYGKYLNIYQQYPQTLVCPCTTISMKYDRFVQVEVRFHQVCNSSLVSEAYFHLLQKSQFDLTSDPIGSGSYHLQFVASWCRLARESVIDDRNAFYATEFIANEVLIPHVFNQQVLSLLELFVASTISTYVRSLALIRETTEVNGFQSGFLTNFIPIVRGSIPDLELVVYGTVYNHGTCSCMATVNCSQQLTQTKGNVNSSGELLKIPGLVASCYVEQGTLQSTLECYYNQTCLDMLHFYVNPNIIFNISALDATRTDSRFNVTTLVGDLVSQMMIEQWSNGSSHASFYDACQPLTCTYSYTGKNELIVVITTIIGLVGGIVNVLKLLVPRFVHLLRRCRWRGRRQLTSCRR